MGWGAGGGARQVCGREGGGVTRAKRTLPLALTSGGPGLLVPEVSTTGNRVEHDKKRTQADIKEGRTLAADDAQSDTGGRFLGAPRSHIGQLAPLLCTPPPAHIQDRSARGLAQHPHRQLPLQTDTKQGTRARRTWCTCEGSWRTAPPATRARRVPYRIHGTLTRHQTSSSPSHPRDGGVPASRSATWTVQRLRLV